MATALLSATAFTSVGAQTLNWGPSGAGGSGTWNNTAVDWFNLSTAVPWTGGDNAVFGGTAGTVTVNGTVAVGGATFNTNGYTITGGTLAVAGSALTISGASNAIGATIGSTISGSNLIVLGGSVTLSSLGAISYTGSTTVANGATLTLTSPNIASAIQSTAFFVNGPSTLVVNAQNREDIHGTITFDRVGGGTVDFTGTLNFGGAVMSGPTTIVATGGAQDRVISSSGIGLNINVNIAPGSGLTLNTADVSSSLLVSSRLWNRGIVTKTGPGMAILTFANIYSGPTEIKGGVLSVSNLANGGVASNIGQSSNAAANLFLDGGTLQYTGAGASTDRLFTLTTNGGGIDASGSGSLIFSNIGSVALTGAGARSLTLTGSSTGANTFAPVLGDSGGPTSLVKTGAGTWVLAGANTYTGGTAINGGTLRVSADSNLGAATGPLSFNGGTLATTNTFTSVRTTTLDAGGGTIDVAPTTTLTMHGAIAGTGAFTKIDTGTLVLTGTNTYTGGTTIAQGTLQLGDGITNGSIVGNVADNSTLAFDPAARTTVSFGGVISGSGSVNRIGTGTTELTGANSYSGGTTITQGTLQLGDGTTNGSIVGNVADNSTLAFDPATRTTISFDGVISGGGSVNQIGAGTTVLTGANSYSGGTLITAGTLQIGNGGTAGSITGNVTDNGTFAFNRSGDEKTFDGLVSGSGDLVKLGSDTLVLTANNTYSGGTIIQDGTLVAGALNPAQATSFALGTGDVFLQGGTLRTPSLDPLIINVSGNYTQGPGGTLALGVAGINGADYDHVQVGGNASLNGTLAVSSLNNFHPVAGNAFGVLETGGSRSGRFAAVNDFLNNNPNLQRVDVYAPNGVALVYLTAVTPAPTLTPTPTPNPRPPVNVVVPVPLPPVNPDAPLSLSFLLPILDPTAEQLTALYEIGFSGANTQRFKLDERFDEIQRGSTGFVSNLPLAPAPVIGTATGKEIATKQPVPPPPPPENRWGVWANGWGDWVTVDNDGQAKGYNFTTGGFIIGVDYRLTHHFAVGLMGSYAYTRTNLQPSGNIDTNTGRGGVYLTYFANNFYINAGTYGGHNSYNTSRQAILGMANGSTSSGEFSTWTESGYDWHIGNFSVGPNAALQYTLVDVDSFNETGSLLPLHFQSNQQTSLRTDFGILASYAFQLGKVSIIPVITAAWEHEYFYSNLPVTVSSPDFLRTVVTLSGPNEGHDSAIINAGAAVQWTPQLSTFIGYQGQLGRNRYNANAITGGFGFSF